MEEVGLTYLIDLELGKGALRYLVFGANGYLGSAICKELENCGHEVVQIVRGPAIGGQVSLDDSNWLAQVTESGAFNGAVWAQGANSSGGVLEEDEDNIRRIFDANVMFIASTLRGLVENAVFCVPARTVILSSVWQHAARPKKLAYILAKSAISGLVPSLAVDLADHGISVNAVLPGVVESPMAVSNLSQEQLDEFRNESMGGELATSSDVARVTRWLLSPDSKGLNAQSLTVDHGWSKVRYV